MSDPRHLALSWTIASDFGGLEHAMFARIRGLATFAGLSTDVVTFHHDPDLGDLRRSLADHQHIPEKTRILNLWEDMAAVDDDDLRGWDLGIASPLVDWEHTTAVQPSGERRRDAGYGRGC